LAKALKDFGDRVHFSVFEFILDGELLDKMVERIEDIISKEEDSVRIYAMCGACEKTVRIIGTGELTTDKDVYIV
ncbi:MAG: CRISPR-associated endonuclease Cas2, partial [Desulfosalsimonadaceae bacterium]|nr:CRISPR-associated endonuclease Cas2 [Desulfosalsimonadaceae bacterium]